MASKRVFRLTGTDSGDDKDHTIPLSHSRAEGHRQIKRPADGNSLEAFLPYKGEKSLAPKSRKSSSTSAMNTADNTSPGVSQTLH